MLTHKQLRAAGVEGMQVQQHIVRIKQRAQDVGNAVFKILRNRTRRHVAVQVALTGALPALVGQRVGDGHKGHRAAFDAELAAVNLLQQLRDGFGAADFVAVYRTQDQQLGAGRQAVAGFIDLTGVCDVHEFVI